MSATTCNCDVNTRLNMANGIHWIAQSVFVKPSPVILIYPVHTPLNNWSLLSLYHGLTCRYMYRALTFFFSCFLLTWIYLKFQVFGTDVMVTVAKSFEAPIKCKPLLNTVMIHCTLVLVDYCTCSLDFYLAITAEKDFLLQQLSTTHCCISTFQNHLFIHVYLKQEFSSFHPSTCTR